MRSLTATFALIVSGTAVAPTAAQEFPYGRSQTFDVYRNGQPIGQHTLTFQQDGASRTVIVAVDLAVKALGVVAYRYQHNSKEVWSNNALQALEARTDDNGQKYSVSVKRANDGLAVERHSPPVTVAAATTSDQGLQPSTFAREVLPATLMPTTHWNMGQVGQSALLNTQYGTRSKTQVTTVGREAVNLANGNVVQAMRYHYTGDIRMDQWFDDRGRWVKSSFPAHDGSSIDYVLRE
ncbi:DUF6134 family protein [Reyranella sp.]|uniref:DUF6134 family protein n=1 Tax=Reyranella sp. TaxID=1929291 RepID=UPI00378485D3